MCEQIILSSFWYRNEMKLTVSTLTPGGELKDWKHYPLYPHPHYTHHLRSVCYESAIKNS